MSTYIVKFRCSNHKLAIGTGRYVGVMREDRHCDMCSMNTLGDEYHLFFECNNPDVEMLRRQYVPIYYRNHHSMYILLN